jgi:citrate lyase beta subunit
MTAEREQLAYRVGALMYAPALNSGVGEKICGGAFPLLDSLALCLEDAVTAEGVREAEAQLSRTMQYISEHEHGRLPLLFVRVRDCAQLRRLPLLLGETAELLAGVIFPKFDLSNAAEYCSQIATIDASRRKPLYIMPILESKSVMDLAVRQRTLLGIRELLDGCREYVLNVRVGAMDFSNLYGLRRSINQSIYDISVVSSALADVLTVFANDYVVSAPVWEYFKSELGNDDWAVGLEDELRLDIANGFIGKTVIHPSQVPIVHQWLRPTRADYEDAKSVIDWQNGSWGVAKSYSGNRMNELATHVKWAKKILTLAQIYGVRDV